MINDVTYCLMQVFSVIFVWAIVNRICNCFEQCSLNKSLGSAYKQMNPNLLNDMVKKKMEENKEK